MPATIFYHADCLDGFGAAWAAWKKFGASAIYRPMHHGDAYQPHEIDGRDIYILDFSFPPETLEAMAERAASVTQIDHHASARLAWCGRLEKSAKNDESFRDSERQLNVFFDMEHSGAALGWQHFHPGEEMPLLLRHIEDNDLWRFTLPGTRPICRTLRLTPFDFPAWDELINQAATGDSPGYRELLTRGEAIETFYQTEVRRLADGNLVTPARLRGEPVDALQAIRHGQPTISDGESTWLAVEGHAINASALFASELGNLLAERNGSFAAIWQLAPDGEAKVSLRSKGDFDVAAIAMRYGGGGHRNAAGFRLAMQQFLSEVLAIRPPPQ